MIKHNAILLFLMIIFSVSPLLNISTALDPYCYSTLILSRAISTNGFIDFENFTLGDHWRYHAHYILGDIRPLTSILITILNQMTLLDPIYIASIPLFAMLIPVFIYLFVRRILGHNSLHSYILSLFCIASVSILRPFGIDYLSYGFFLLGMLLYISTVHVMRYKTRSGMVLILIILIASSRTYYTSYISSAIFLLGMFLFYVFLFSKWRHQQSLRFTLVTIIFLFVLLWYDNILLNIKQTASFENIWPAITNMSIYKWASSLSISTLYVERVPIDFVRGYGFTITNFIIRIGMGVLGIYAFIFCLKKRQNVRYELPVVFGLLLMGLFETMCYTLIGGALLVRLLYSIALPYIIILWATQTIKRMSSHNRRKYAILLIIFCILSTSIVLRNFTYAPEYSYPNKNVMIIDLIMHDPETLFDRNTSYIIAASTSESAFISYTTFKPGYSIVATLAPFPSIIAGDLNGFLVDITSLPQDEKLILLPKHYPYIEGYAWGDIYLLKSEIFIELNQRFNIILDGPIVIYEIS